MLLKNIGKPLTTVGAQAPATSDTTRYHIYHDGKIKRENKAATGSAEFIYYEANGTQHNLGKSAFIVANKWYKKSIKGASNVYLVDQRKHQTYKNGNIGYLWKIQSDDRRYYLNSLALASVFI